MPDQPLHSSEFEGDTPLLPRHWFHWCVLPALILAIFVSWVIEAEVFFPKEPLHRPAFFEWTMKAGAAEKTSIKYVTENAISGTVKVHVMGREGDIERVAVIVPRYALYRKLSMKFPEDCEKMKFTGVTFRSYSGKWSRAFSSSDFTRIGSSAELIFDPYLRPTDPWEPEPLRIALRFVVLFLGFAALSHGLFRSARARKGFAEVRKKCVANPRRAIFAAAVCGVVVSCYPIVFCGMSWVSPNSGQPLLYHSMWTLPMEHSEMPEDPAGSDSGATLNIYLPMVFQTHRALFNDGELPLWNRNSWCGVSQIGQFGLMWGDPLQWIPILAGGDSWAWDLKMVITRLIYAFGCGLLVLRTCGSLRVALVLTVSACFHGFFLFRTAHVSVLPFAYMPWILLAWVEASHSKSARSAMRWGGLLIAATWQGMNGASAKEPMLTIAAMNLLGGLIVLTNGDPLQLRLRKFAMMCWANVLLLCLAAPFWMVLLESIKKGFSVYQIVKVYQLQPSLLIGLFDEVFQRQVTPHETMLSAGANFLIFLGFLWSVVCLRHLRQSAMFVWSALCLLVGGAFIYGVVPPSLLAKIPILQTIYHFDITFSFMIFTPLLVVAGFGLRVMWDRISEADWRWGYSGVVLIFGVLYGAYAGYTVASHRVGFSVHKVGEQYETSWFFSRYVPMISLSLLALPLLVRAVRLRRVWAPSAGVLAFLACGIIHLRMGSHLNTSFDHYTYNPKSRSDYSTMKSPGIDFLKSVGHPEPARVYGLNMTLVPGFSSILNVENICGAEPFESRYLGALYEALNLERNNWLWRIAATHANYAGKQRALDFIGVRYLLSDAGDPMPDPALLPIVHSSDLQVGESKGAWPRAFFTDTGLVANTVKDVAQYVATEDGRPFAAVAADIVSGQPSLAKPAAERKVVGATNYRLTANTTKFEVDASGPGLAVLHETNVPGDIIAKVDGIEVPCLMVNGAFRGASIPSAGKHTVEFTFYPHLWFLTFRFTLVGAGLSIATFLLLRRARRREHLLTAPIGRITECDGMASANSNRVIACK